MRCTHAPISTLTNTHTDTHTQPRGEKSVSEGQYEQEQDPCVTDGICVFGFLLFHSIFHICAESRVEVAERADIFFASTGI
jgi:hypothetical protein